MAPETFPKQQASSWARGHGASACSRAQAKTVLRAVPALLCNSELEEVSGFMLSPELGLFLYSVKASVQNLH